MVTFTDEFSAFVDRIEPRLRRALVAARGPDLGRQATVDALVYGWLHWARVQKMTNPVGYLYRVGISAAKPLRALPVLGAAHNTDEVWVEPDLERGLRALTESQRVAVTLHHCFGWTYEDVGGLLGVGVSTVRNHIDRGMKKLRLELGVSLDV